MTGNNLSWTIRKRSITVHCTCIVQFSDLSALGRIGGKTIGLYLFTTVIAVLVGFGVFYLFQPGNVSIGAAAAVEDRKSVV